MAIAYNCAMRIISPLIKVLLHALPESSHWRIPFGVMRGIRWCFNSANPGQTLGRYEPKIEANFIELVECCTAFWDVGANVGWFSLLASKLNKEVKVVAFEPDPSNLKYLQNHKELNQFSNIKVLANALGADVKEALFLTDNQHGRLSSVGGVVVQLITADHYIEHSGLIPDLIKIDIEGGETDFLIGATGLLKNHKPTLIVSAHGYQKRDQCIDILNKHDYSIEHLIADSQRGDYVFVAR